MLAMTICSDPTAIEEPEVALPTLPWIQPEGSRDDLLEEASTSEPIGAI